MARLSINIYKECRNRADLTQEVAAEYLNIGKRTLARYEAGEVIPPEDVVYNMCILYNSFLLGYEHLRITSRLGIECLPELLSTGLAESVLRFQKEKKDVVDLQNEIVEIAMDNVIDEEERPKWNDIMKEIRELVGALMSLYLVEKEDKYLEEVIS